MTYAAVHDRTVADDYFRAMEQIEGEQGAFFGRKPVPETIQSLLSELAGSKLDEKQRHLLEMLGRSLD